MKGEQRKMVDVANLRELNFEDFKDKTHTSQQQIDDDRTEEEILKSVKAIIGG